ncbi:hypothetical protein HYH03_007459 [Edaphochlamys debaryana]|uniref:Uncharacterized protein n=1 Tax=Edaphochlamys debaryana TaxID=47281 RepID=A0A835Y3A8_9CHLO|nr:hypothetical protein HYH03_007459 [Edaphochlamys debaryana]|eukprot:KAG2494407.1 hypothetical protein HYH03_007459 [Edaphochlamys debaryana]
MEASAKLRDPEELVLVVLHRWLPRLSLNSKDSNPTPLHPKAEAPSLLLRFPMGARRAAPSAGLLWALAVPALALLLAAGCSGAAAEMEDRPDFLTSLEQELAREAAEAGEVDDMEAAAEGLPFPAEAWAGAPRDGEDPDNPDAGLNHTPGSARRLLQALRVGPLPGLTLRPGVGLGVADAAFAGYVITAQDPIAIALRQLSIVAINAIGTEVNNAIKRAVRDIDAELARYATYLGRQVDSLEDANLPEVLAAVQTEVRVLVLVRASLEDTRDRLIVYSTFVTSSVSAWTSYIYGIQYRFQALILALLSSNDPFGFELGRVLFSLSDLTKLVGLILKPFIAEFKYSQSFLNNLNGIIFATYTRERNRLTFTPSIALDDPIGSGKNLQAVVDQVLELAGKKPAHIAYYIEA